MFTAIIIICVIILIIGILLLKNNTYYHLIAYINNMLAEANIPLLLSSTPGAIILYAKRNRNPADNILKTMILSALIILNIELTTGQNHVYRGFLSMKGEIMKTQFLFLLDKAYSMDFIHERDISKSEIIAKLENDIRSVG